MHLRTLIQFNIFIMSEISGQGLPATQQYRQSFTCIMFVSVFQMGMDVKKKKTLIP